MAKSNRLYCTVYGCLNSSLTHPELTFFRLPGDSERRLKWLKLICRNDLKNKPNFAAYRLCEKHFNLEDIRQSVTRKLLKRNALPLLMLPSYQDILGSGIEDKQTQTDLSIGVEKCTQTENAANDSYVQTSTSLSCSCNTPRKTKLKPELLRRKKTAERKLQKIKLQETKKKSK